MTWHGLGGRASLYTAALAAEKLGITMNTLRQQRLRGRIRAVKIGRDYFYEPGAIRDYQKLQQTQTDAPGFASPKHPLHGKRGAGGRRKSATTTTTEYDHPEKPDASP